MTDTEAQILLLYNEVTLFGTFKQYFKHNLCNIHESLIFLNSLKEVRYQPNIFKPYSITMDFIGSTMSMETDLSRQRDSMTSASHNFSTKFFFTNYFQALI